MNKKIQRLMIVLAALIFSCTFLNAQIEDFKEEPIGLNLELKYRLIAHLHKSVSYSSLITKNILNNRYAQHNVDTINYLNNIHGFGYLPQHLEFEVHAVDLGIENASELKFYALYYDHLSNQNKPVLDWQRMKNDRLFIYSFDRTFANSPYFILAVNQNDDILVVSCIGRMCCLNPIAEYFSLNSNIPSSYIPFLQAKFFDWTPPLITFEKRDADFLYFLVENKSLQNATLLSEYKISISYPDSIIFSRQVSIDTSGSKKIEYLRDSASLPFINLQDKQNYLFNSLMRNIYGKRILSLDNFSDTLGLIPNTYYSDPNKINRLDSLLPNYDEVIKGMELEKTPCCGEVNLWRCFQDKVRHLQFPIFDETYRRKTRPNLRSYYKHVVVGFEFNGIEYYRIRRPEKEILERQLTSEEKNIRIGPWEVNTTSWERRDWFWNPEKEFNGRPEGWTKAPPIPPPPPLVKVIRSFDRHTGKEIIEPLYANCHEYQKDSTYHKPHVEYPRFVYHDYYLVGLDRNTREVFFISGADILLSRVLNLYAPGEFSKEELLVPFREWPMQNRFTYVRDRLYSYQVSDVNEEHLTYQDEEKMIFEVKGIIKNYGRVLIEVTVQFDQAELVETKILSYLTYE